MKNPYSSGWSAERPENRQYDVREGDYLPPDSGAQRTQKAAKGLGAAGLGLAVLAAKFKSVLFLLLNLKFAAIAIKLFWFAGSFLASIWFYALFFSWPFAVIFVILIAIHEFGHWFTMRFYGVPSSLPFFIPGMGALVNMQGKPPSAFHESLIAFAGPAAGAAASGVCAWIGFQYHEPFWIAAAYVGFFLNLFNLAPVMPLDGGRVVGSISPRIWVAGLVLFVIAIFAFHINNPLVWILILISLPQVWAAFKGQLDAHYYGISLPQRLTVTGLYFSLAGVLFAGMLYTHVSVGSHLVAQ